MDYSILSFHGLGVYSIAHIHTLDFTSYKSRRGQEYNCIVADLRLSQLATFPSEIRYTILKVNGSNDINYFLPRRDLSDVKAQVKIEGNGSLGSLLSGCDDLVTQKYEGGFKTWESSIDLAELLSRSYATTTDHGFPDYECCIEVSTNIISSVLVSVQELQWSRVIKIKSHRKL